MKYIIFFLFYLIGIQNCVSQIENPCPCEHLNTNWEGRHRKEYREKPCLLDFVKANIADSSLIRFVGKKPGYARYSQEYCDESKATYINLQSGVTERITFLKERYFLSKSKFDFDTMFLEAYDIIQLIPVSIE